MKNPIFQKSNYKYTYRQLVKNPGFTFLSVMVLALGLGLSIFTFTVSYTFSYKPLQIENGKSIVQLCGNLPTADCGRFKAFEFALLREDIESLENVGVFRGGDAYLEYGDLIRSVIAVETQWNLFQLSNAQALQGRTLQPIDHQPGAEAVAVISYGLWQQVFAGGTEIVNAVITVDGNLTRIIGIMPEGYAMPSRGDLWLPVSANVLSPVEEDTTVIQGFARLKPGVSSARASQEVNTLMHRIRQLYPFNPDNEFVFNARIEQNDSAHVVSFPLSTMGGLEGTLLLGTMNLLAGLVFLLACINIGTLLLARTNGRLKDISVKVALGAPKAMLFFQTMSESIVICSLGGIMAIFVAGAGLELLNLFFSQLRLTPQFWMSFSIDQSTLLAVVLFVIAALIFTSAIPCWRIVNGDFNAVLRDGTRGAVGVQAGRFSRSLVVVAIALITLLLYVGTLGGTAMLSVKQNQTEMDSENLLAVSMVPDSERHSTNQQIQFYRSLTVQAAVEPVIDNALIRLSSSQVRVTGGSADGSRSSDIATAVSHTILGSMHTLNTSLLAGRELEEFDSTINSDAAVISAALAQALWPKQSALGKEFSFSSSSNGRNSEGLSRFQVVGVVTDNLFPSGDIFPNRLSVYLPGKSSDSMPDSAILIVKHTGDSAKAASIVSRWIENFDPEMSYYVADFERQSATMVEVANWAIALIIGCGVFAFLIAITGIYGITKNSVTLKTQEIGTIRALGATDTHVRNTFVRIGVRQAVIGVTASLIILAPVTYLIMTIGAANLVVESLLPFLAVVTAVFATVLAAIIYPIRQILKLEPGDALRYE